MLSTELGPDYEELGRLVARDIRDDPENTMLYAEVEPGTIEPSLFKDYGDRIVYREPSEDLIDKLFDIWEGLDKRDRWFSIRYDIEKVGKDYKFKAFFTFKDDIDDYEDDNPDRREEVAMARFGNKPFDYSEYPPPED